MGAQMAGQLYEQSELEQIELVFLRQKAEMTKSFWVYLYDAALKCQV